MPGRDGTPLLFPRRFGTAWSHCGFWDDVVQVVRRKAAKPWREDRGQDEAAETPFVPGHRMTCAARAATLLKAVAVPPS